MALIYTLYIKPVVSNTRRARTATPGSSLASHVLDGTSSLALPGSSPEPMRYLPSQALTLPGFALTHFSAAFAGSMCSPGDQVRDEVLVVGRPLPALDHAHGRRAALRELRRHQLVDDRLAVRALVDVPVAPELRVVRVDAGLAARRQLDLRELVRLVQVLRRVPVEEDRLLLLVGLRPAARPAPARRRPRRTSG